MFTSRSRARGYAAALIFTPAIIVTQNLESYNLEMVVRAGELVVIGGMWLIASMAATGIAVLIDWATERAITRRNKELYYD